ncbi:EamA/RhaT family transporter [Gordonia sputi]|uniref:EamA/RhaT family transporter n=1 Tax=Gordonia sputi TaxID=36823 RepID=UPI00204344C0|nr:EamA/RhaT family transporter [Gordonia sputi]MCM3894580.1 EamA/RhaT family transporter [Gordonia sputi]
MFLIGVIAASLAAVAYGMSTVLRALGARRAAQTERDEGIETTNAAGGPTLRSTASTFVDPAFILGTVLVTVGFAGGAVAARYLPLFLSQTIVSANLVITALLGTIMLNIALHTRDWVAIWLVVFSLCLLGMSSSHQTGDSGGYSFHWLLFFATIVLSVLALLSVYRLGRHGAIAGGAAAGLLFGVIAIAVRILDGIHPFDPVRLLLDPAAWTIAVAGAVGFFVQTVALQLGAVNGVTAVLVVGETAGPSLIGVMFLGDQAKPGLGWLALVGFVGAVVGAVLVAWYGSGDPDHFGEAPPMKGGWRRGREDDEFDDEYDEGEFESDEFESGQLRSDMTASDEIDSFGFAPADFDDDDFDDEDFDDDDFDDENDEDPSGDDGRSGAQGRSAGDGSVARSDIDFTDVDLDDRQHSQRYSR